MNLLPVSRRLKRLRAAVEVRRVRAQSQGAAAGGAEAERIQKHLDLAQAAAKARRVNEGWGHLHEAERLEVALYDADELKAMVVDLRTEARDSRKFGKWRRNAILEHLAGDQGLPVKACDVQHALGLRSEHFDNVYSKIDETLFWIAWASGAVVFILAVLLAGAAYGWIPVGPGTVNLMAIAVLMGAMGGALSTGLSLARTDPNRSIPDLLMEGSVTAFRPILGGAMAAVTFVFIKAGLLDFLASGMSEKSWLMASFAFIAGYSERWFIGIVNRLTDERATKDDKPPGG